RFNNFALDPALVPASFGPIFPKAVFFSVLHVLGMIALGQYQAEQYRGNNDFASMVSRVVVSMMLVSLAMIILFFFLPSVQMGRGITALAVSSSMICVIILRRLFFLLADKDLFRSKVLVFGT